MSKHAGRVLVVDDDPGLRDICTQTLQRADFTVETADGAAAGLEKLTHTAYDLVLLDIYMPDLDGLSLLERIRAQDITVPILIISGMATVEQAAHAMRLGASGLILKPFATRELVELATEVVQKRRAARASDRGAALRPVLQVSQRILGELDLDRLHDLIIETVRAELDADRASLMLLDAQGATMRIAACSGLPSEVRVGHKVPVAGRLAGWVATNRQPLRVDARGEVTPATAALRGALFADQIVTALSVPVLAGERVLGVLNAAKVRAGRPFTDADQELLLLLAGQAAIAIENARLYSRVAQSEERYRALLHHANDAVLLFDVAGRKILDANLALEQLSGYTRNELLALTPDQLFPKVAELQQQAQQQAQSGRGNGQAPRENYEIETSLCTSGDQAMPVAVSVSAITHAGQQLLLLFARDISERQRIAKQLVQTEKLAALGRLSASMAHEINNPLQAIHNSVHLLLSRPLPEEKRQRYLTMTMEEIERLISIVQRILDFYRPTRDGMRPVNMNDILEAVLNLTANQLEEAQVTVMRDCQAHLPRVFAVSNHVKQVCFNLIFNAIEAMTDTGGTLTVRSYVVDASNDSTAAAFTTVSGVGANNPVQGPAVVIEISDTGPGIPPHDLPKVFEPFYTTRMKGTGLGLAVSYSIIEQHHGELAVRSELGQGTTFRITLPVAQ
jgi:two-component system, NtrC family, sensor kinase